MQSPTRGSSLREPSSPPRDLTPYPGARVSLHQLVRSDPDHVLVTHNRRDPSAMDLYRLHLGTGEETPIAESDGSVMNWITDAEGRLVARQRRLAQARREAEQYSHFDYVVINDEVERATVDIEAIIRAERLRASRNVARADEIIDSFPE